MKREIARTPSEVTSVEYVRCRAAYPASNRAAEIFLRGRELGISSERKETGQI